MVNGGTRDKIQGTKGQGDKVTKRQGDKGNRLRRSGSDKVKNMRSSPSAGGRTRLTIHPTESDTATIHHSPHNMAGERDGLCVGGGLIFIRRRC